MIGNIELKKKIESFKLIYQKYYLPSPPTQKINKAWLCTLHSLHALFSFWNILKVRISFWAHKFWFGKYCNKVPLFLYSVPYAVSTNSHVVLSHYYLSCLLLIMIIAGLAFKFSTGHFAGVEHGTPHTALPPTFISVASDCSFDEKLAFMIAFLCG